jgi:hypothetical protein
MNDKSHLSDLPDFLRDSPFFLPDQYEYQIHRPPKPTPKQIIKSKKFRLIIYAAFTTILLYFLRRKAKEVDLWGHLTGPPCYYREATEPPVFYGDNKTEWSKFAYAQYATDTEYLCNSLMLFESLDRLGSKADRLLMYPENFPLDARAENKNTELLLKAKLEYGAKLVPVEVEHNNLAACECLQDNFHPCTDGLQTSVQIGLIRIRSFWRSTRRNMLACLSWIQIPPY